MIVLLILLSGLHAETGRFPAALHAETLEERLARDIRNHVLNDFSHIEAAFILSGVNKKDSLDLYLDWYRGLVQEIRNMPSDPADRPGNAARVFNVLHARWFRTYQLEATTLLDVVHEKRFNCVSATILYNLICEDLGWETMAFETPTHVYTLFLNFTQELMVENTSPMGFDIMKNLKEYTRYIAHYYPESEVARIGLDRLYYHEQSRGRRIDNTELLGLLAYNQAYFARKRGDYARAYDLVLLAQDFNRDSRSNTQFERGLYHAWGKKLFDEKNYTASFAVLADGAYRYPGDPGLTQNTRAAFHRAMQSFRIKGDWESARQMTEELLELRILDADYGKALRRMIGEWRDILARTGRTVEAEEAASLTSRIAAGLR
ncbi:MAG TPA: hypothetical protein ENN17_03840 [bacterium]|nr:hypothetical protein [bacterium]